MLPGAQISRHDLPHWMGFQRNSNFPQSMHASNSNQCVMFQLVGSEIFEVLSEESRHEICCLGHRFHVMACLIGWDSNGIQIFQLQQIAASPPNVTCTNELDRRSPRCSQRSHDVKFVLRGTDFTS